MFFQNSNNDRGNDHQGKKDCQNVGYPGDRYQGPLDLEKTIEMDSTVNA